MRKYCEALIVNFFKTTVRQLLTSVKNLYDLCKEKLKRGAKIEPQFLIGVTRWLQISHVCLAYICYMFSVTCLKLTIKTLEQGVKYVQS